MKGAVIALSAVTIHVIQGTEVIMAVNLLVFPIAVINPNVAIIHAKNHPKLALLPVGVRAAYWFVSTRIAAQIKNIVNMAVKTEPVLRILSHQLLVQA